MSEERRLKRGLSDISPLFASKRNQKAVVEEQKPSVPKQGETSQSKPEDSVSSVHCLSVMSPDNPSDSFFLNSFMANRIASDLNRCSIITIDSRHHPRNDLTQRRSTPHGFGSNMKRSHLTWDEFESICNRPIECSGSRAGQKQIIFLDIDYDQVPKFERVIPVLDKWVLVVQPNVESIKNAYKMIKGSIALNSHLEYYLIFEGSPNEQRESFLFEKLSGIVAEKLSVQIGWLGYLTLPKNGRSPSHNISLDNLFLKPTEGLGVRDKFALADHMMPVLGSAAEEVS